jgi:hypothetical protein
MDFIVRNRLTILFGILIVLEALTWRSVVSVEEEVASVWRLVNRAACGGSRPTDDPCRVIIVSR